MKKLLIIAALFFIYASSQRVCWNDYQCQNGGKCNKEARKCECADGFEGDYCQGISIGGAECKVKDDCDKGHCFLGKCKCFNGFYGKDCALWFKFCKNNCSNNGMCQYKISGQNLSIYCKCNDGWSGDDCSSKACPNNCSGNGFCLNGKCYCNNKYQGSLDCSKVNPYW